MELPHLKIADYDYPLPEERIARFPLARRDESKLLVWRNGAIEERRFDALDRILPAGATLVFNNTRVVRARLVMHKPSGARIEIFCLEPCDPADYERTFAATESCSWHCIVGNLKKWKEGALEIGFDCDGRPARLTALREHDAGREQIVRFAWDAPLTFGQLLEHLGRIPIPPYLGRDSQEIDNTRYQTVYARIEGSVAAPTAGLHFTPELIGRLSANGHPIEEITLHVGAGTFLPVKEDDVTRHAMHAERFEVPLDTLCRLRAALGKIIAVGTTSVRTLESLQAVGRRILDGGSPRTEEPVGQWEIYDTPDNVDGARTLDALIGYMECEGLQRIGLSTRIMIMPPYRFRIVSGMITNFHQPKSTLLLLVAAFTGERWRPIYDYALARDFRFLSYGDSSLLLP